MGAWGAPLLWLALVLGHGRALPQAARTETHPPLTIRPLSVPPPPGALLYTARCAALRATSGSEGSGCHQAQRTGGGEPQRGVLPSRGLSRALTLTSFSDSYPRLDLWPEREHVFKTLLNLQLAHARAPDKRCLIFPCTMKNDCRAHFYSRSPSRSHPS